MPDVSTPAILLRSHPYSESSRVLRFYARDLGLVGVMARGAGKRASKGRGGAGTFAEGTAVVSVRHNRELQTLREFAPQKARLGLAAGMQRLAGAALAAELVLRHAAQEPHAHLYDLLSRGLDRLADAPDDAVAGHVLALGWTLTQAFGFSPELSACTGCGTALAEEMARFDLGSGGVRCSACGAPQGSRRIGPGARRQVARFLHGEPAADFRGPSAHLALLDDFATYHLLGGRRPASIRFLRFADRHVPARP